MKRMLYRVSTAILSVYFLSISVFAAGELIPVGDVIGLELSSGVVTVAAYDDTLTAARDAGLKIGDEILAIDGHKITCAEDVRQALNRSDGSIRLLVSRDGKETELQLEPAISPEGPKMGVYLRQGITGLGTVTFYDPVTGQFGTLGHSVNDGSGELLNMESGRAYPAEVVSIQKGEKGQPGQLKGALEASQLQGILERNTPRGVFGTAEHPWQGEALPVAFWEEIHTGEATIRSTVGSSGPRDYSVEIVKIYPKDRKDGRNLLLRVTDPELLAATGGIVQGMSGSPIIQDGKLVGAVTHVLVNSPDTGYGIFIENMLDAAG